MLAFIETQENDYNIAMPASADGRQIPQPLIERLDARGVRPPDNILAVLKKASELPKGTLLEIELDANPFQLYDLLQQRGYFLDMKRNENGGYSGIVKPRPIEDLSH